MVRLFGGAPGLGIGAMFLSFGKPANLLDLGPPGLLFGRTAGDDIVLFERVQIAIIGGLGQ